MLIGAWHSINEWRTLSITWKKRYQALWRNIVLSLLNGVQIHIFTSVWRPSKTYLLTEFCSGSPVCKPCLKLTKNPFCNFAVFLWPSCAGSARSLITCSPQPAADLLWSDSPISCLSWQLKSQAYHTSPIYLLVSLLFWAIHLFGNMMKPMHSFSE